MPAFFIAVVVNVIHRIRNAHIFAPEDLGIQQLLVAGGRIVYIGQALPELDVRLLSTDDDLDGQRLIPGLVDGHAHITGGGGEAGFSTRVPPVPLSQFTRAGVTSVVGLLGTDDVTRNTSSIIAQAYALREEGLSAWCYTGGYHLPATTLTGSVRSDIVHIDCIVGVGEVAISDHRSSQPTFDDLARLASEAHVAGLITGKAGIVHLHLGDGPRGLSLINRLLDDTELPPRVFNPTHCNRRKALFEEACELAGRGCWIDLTAFPVDEGEDAWTAADAAMRYWDGGSDNRYLTISSDGGGCLPHFDRQGEITHLDYGRSQALPETLAELLARGVPLPLALGTMTRNVADLLRLPGKGRIAVGADADLVILDDRTGIDSVMARGVWHRRAGEQLIVGGFEPSSKA